VVEFLVFKLNIFPVDLYCIKGLKNACHHISGNLKEDLKNSAERSIGELKI